jgi:2-polyprenyl-3-methyl-5-hydroxy-6-metoxy-1,4-benzoquinol methylase
MAQFWDERYQAPGFVYGEKPNIFLQSVAGLLPQGRVLCLAEGEGRNAVYLASLGYDVTAVDQSTVGLKKAHLLADKHGVKITTHCSSLEDYVLQPSYWSAIVSIWAHVPSVLRRKVHQKIVQSLVQGGVFVLEAYTPEQLQMPSVGGPKNPDLLMDLKTLKSELGFSHYILAQEITRDVQEGVLHQGQSAVVQIAAQKKGFF